MYITTFAFLNSVNVSLLLLSESWPVMTASSKAQEKYELRGKSFSCLKEIERMGRDREQTSSNSITSILTTRTGERMNQTGQIAIVKLKTLPTQNKKTKREVSVRLVSGVKLWRARAFPLHFATKTYEKNVKTPKTVPVGIAYGADVFQSSLICLTTPNLCFVFVFRGNRNKSVSCLTSSCQPIRNNLPNSQVHEDAKVQTESNERSYEPRTVNAKKHALAEGEVDQSSSRNTYRAILSSVATTETKSFLPFPYHNIPIDTSIHKNPSTLFLNPSLS